MSADHGPGPRGAGAMTAAEPLAHGWWLASRAAGVVALLLLALTVGLGLTMAGRLDRRPGATRRLRRLHEDTALVALSALAVHALTLLGDPWLHPGAAGLAVPFTMAYRPFATGLGVVAAYAAALLGLSFYVRTRIGPRLWRRLHRLTIVVYALAVLHALLAGTDAATPWLRAVVLATALPIAVLLALRLSAGRRRRRTTATRAATARRAGATP